MYIKLMPIRYIGIVWKHWPDMCEFITRQGWQNQPSESTVSSIWRSGRLHFFIFTCPAVEHCSNTYQVYTKHMRETDNAIYKPYLRMVSFVHICTYNLICLWKWSKFVKTANKIASGKLQVVVLYLWIKM